MVPDFEVQTHIEVIFLKEVWSMVEDTLLEKTIASTTPILDILTQFSEDLGHMEDLQAILGKEMVQQALIIILAITLLVLTEIREMVQWANKKGALVPQN